jgi:hypothetical protein
MKRYRVAIISGAVFGASLLVGYFAYESALTPAKPNISTAKAVEVVAYIGDNRGLGNLSQIEQEQFLEQWRDHVAAPAAKADLKSCFDGLEDGARKRFSDAIFKHIKRAFISDAKQFSRLDSPKEKSGFIRKKVDEYRQQALFAKDVAAAFKGDLSKRPEDLQQWAIENTTAEERAISEPYLDALKRVREIVRKEERAGNQTASSTSTN